jgi:starvation-inducible DNA-binding protein
VEVDEAVTAGGVAYDFDGNPLEMALKRLVADSVTAYHHAQGYHWNVKGQDFAQYHALFLSIYEDYLASIDPTAENLLKLGASAPYTHADLDRFRSLPDVSATETPRDMATALLAINDGLRASTKSAFDQAAVADDQGMVDFLGGRLDILDKWSWQLRASIA